MAGSRLDIDGRTIARCDAGPLDAEYALFEPSDLALKATEPGNVREIGYRTTVATARARLDALGVTAELAHEAAEELGPLAVLYARGGTARKVAARLGAAELFEGRELDAPRGLYIGAWMDTAALAKDLVVSRAAAGLQALHLAAVLAEVRDDADVMLHTLDLTRAKRMGERTYQRAELDAAAQIAEALRVLGETSPDSPAEREAGPTRLELVSAMTERLKWCTAESAQTRLTQILAAAAAREQPSRGPLAEPVLWALERQLSEGSTGGVVEQVDALEKTRGRTPATTYLRARAMLMGGLESPEIIAGRVSTLAISLSSFVELQLLAAQAWLLAGDGKRAAAYAKDLTTAASLDPDLRARAEAILAAAIAPPPPAPPTRPSVIDPKRIVSVADDAPPDTSIEPTQVVTLHPATPEHGGAQTTQRMTSDSQPPAKLPSTPPRTISHSQRAGVPYSTITSERSSRPKKTSAPPADGADLLPRDAIAAPRLPSIPEAAPTPVRLPSEPPREPPRRPSYASGLATARLDRAVGSDPAPTIGSAGATGYMKGASQPPFRAEESPDGREKERRHEPLHSESAEFLSLPRMATGEPPSEDSTPRNPTEARILFTFLARELGEDYRVKRGVELRTDVAAIESMQAHLFDSYYGKSVRSLEDWLDVRRHGAFLSEILVRTLSAEWSDVTPRELGYWAMSVPPGTRVWPFARMLRYVAMGPKERDLVSYYLELRWRSR